MVSALFALGLGFLASAGPGLYEEDLLDSAPIRIAQWRQMRAYAESLPKKADPALAAGTAAAPAGGLRRAFAELLGFPPVGLLARPSLRLEARGEDAVAVYRRAYIEVGPRLETYGLFIVPKRAHFPAPLVIAVHGGSGYPELATFHGGTNYHDMVRGAVAQGYVVFAPLTIMWPARDRDRGTPIPKDVRSELDDAFRARGTTLMGVEVAKISRGLDALLTRPEVDSRRVAMIGLSYGGYFTLYTAALDPRIAVAIASGCTSDRPRIDPRHPPRPRPPIDLSTAELVRLISPRPLQVQAGIRDPQHAIGEARRAAPACAKSYPGALAANYDFEAFDGVHEFRGDLAWRFLRQHL